MGLKGEKHCIHALKTDKMLDKTSDLLLSSTFNKLHNTEGSCKTMPFSNI